jgi:hypothetical protein
MPRAKTLLLVLILALPASGPAAGIPLVDVAGAAHGAATVSLPRGLVVLKIKGLAPLPASVDTGSEIFTAHVYKAYLASSTDPAVEIFLGDVYPNAKQSAVRRVALKGDLSAMGLNRIAVTGFSRDGLKSFDVLTASF